MHDFSYRVKPGRPAKSPQTQLRNLKGQRFGSLVVLDYTHSSSGKSWWSCVCDCRGPGSQILVRSDKLTGGQTHACKCRIGYTKTGVPIGTKMPRRPKPSPGLPSPGVPEPTPPSASTSCILHNTPAPSAPLAAPADRPNAPARSAVSPAKLTEAEILSARQMRGWKCPWPDVAAYLALSRPSGCTIAQAQQLTALPQTAA